MAADQFFHDPKDPHVSLATEQHSKYPTRPFYYSYHPAYSQVYTENVWGKATSRVDTEKWSNERAVDKAVNRIQTIVASWKQAPFVREPLPRAGGLSPPARNSFGSMNEISAAAVPSAASPHRERWGGKTLLGLAFCSPLVLMFLGLVITPILYMLYLGLDRTIYPAIFSDPIFIQTLWNTLIFVGLAVNVKMFLALTLSALFSTE